MAKTRAKGGNVAVAEARARVEIAEKCALVAVPVPNAATNPKVFKATTIDDAVGNLNVSFKVKLRKTDGASSREEIHIQSLDDFEEDELAKRSSTLREQQLQKNFLHNFQSELAQNTALREELRIMLESENKNQLVRFLKGWVQQFKKPDPQLMRLLQSNSYHH